VNVDPVSVKRLAHGWYTVGGLVEFTFNAIWDIDVSLSCEEPQDS
jgi:hypothetical protein